MKIRSRTLRRLTWGASIVLAFTTAKVNAVVISEFMASNLNTLVDVDGDASDWIELVNDTEVAVELGGWSLSDDAADPAQWIVPDITLGPGEFLVVFASGKDRRDNAQELHTSFRLARGGDFLGLFSPAGDLVSSFAPEYPAQRVDASFGLTMETSTAALVESSSMGRALVTERRSDLPEGWNLPGLDDSGWAEVSGTLGYDQKAMPTFGDLIATDVGELMQGKNASIFLRYPIVVGAGDQPKLVRLLVQYESGFVAYLNGVEVARRNADATRVNSQAVSPRPVDEALEVEEISLAGASDLFVEGVNILAFQAMNDSFRSEDFLFVPRLESVSLTSVGETPRYFAAPTPGLPNPPSGQSGIAPEPMFSVRSTHFVGEMTIELTAPPETSIHFTTDGSVPTQDSPLYTQPLVRTTTTRIRARTYGPDLVPSEIDEESYLAIAADAADFSSNLPIFVISTFGGGIFLNGQTPMHLQLVEPDGTGRATLDAGRSIAARGIIKQRGTSTRDNPKKSLGVEIQNDRGEDRDVAFFDMPEESDWVLYAPFQDRSLSRNAFMYRLSRQVGRYAVRTRFCEVFTSTSNDQVSLDDYVGLYVFMEKIKRGPERVDVEALGPDDNAEPEVTGGYMVKIDPVDAGDTGFGVAGIDLAWVYPKEAEVTPEQAAWFVGHLRDFSDALVSENVGDLQLGYPAFIDVDSWIDHHILNELSRNADGFKKSSYFFKRRGQKLEYGPIWDFNISLGVRGTPDSWSEVRFFGWWQYLLEDRAFLERYVERWHELRRGPLSTENVNALLDEVVEEIGAEAARRNFERWTPPETFISWDDEVQHIRDWLNPRLEWADGSLEAELNGGLQVVADFNQDGRLNVSDAIGLLRHLFVIGAPAPPCLSDAGNTALLDVNDDTRVDLADAVDTLNYLFGSGAASRLGTGCTTLASCPDLCREEP